MHNWFRKFAAKVSEAVGTPLAFGLALLTIIIWAVTGPIFRFSDTWQLVINTGTTVITFLMVFLIQNAQNRDSRVFHLKLDELIRSIKGARNELVDLEDMDDTVLEELHAEFRELHRHFYEKVKQRGLNPDRAATPAFLKKAKPNKSQ